MLQADILAILHSYQELIYPHPVKDIIAQDETKIIPFIISRLDPTHYYHCLIVNDYLDILDPAFRINAPIHNIFRKPARIAE